MDRTNTENIEHPDHSFLESDVIGIEGMTCDKCVQTIENAFRDQDGVKTVKVDRRRALAEVTFDKPLSFLHVFDPGDRDVWFEPAAQGLNVYFRCQSVHHVGLLQPDPKHVCTAASLHKGAGFR